MLASRGDVVMCLSQSLVSPSHLVEARLEALSCLPGYGVILCQLACTQNPDAQAAGLVQLAAILLKKFVKEHWVEMARGYVPPMSCDADKAAIRQMLPAGLASPSSKVRTAIGMAIAAIASWDWPQDWPGLMEALVEAIKLRSNDSLVHGSLRCLSLMSTDIDERLLPQIVPVLLPELHAIVASGAYPPELQRQALSILHGMVATLSVVGGKEQRQLRDVMAPHVLPWVPTLAALLGAPLSLLEPLAWGVVTEALKVLVQLVSYFSISLGPHTALLLGQCWYLCTNGLELYQQGLVVEGAVVEVEVDADGDPLDLEMLLAQMMELILAFVGSPRFQPQLKPAIRDLLNLGIGYMQMTHSQVEAWSLNPNQFVADGEEQTFTARVSGELLLAELNESFGRECAVLTLQVIEQRLTEATQQLADGKPSWWQLREAALLALGSCSDHIIAACKPGGASSSGAAPKGSTVDPEAMSQRIRSLLTDVMTRDLQGAQGHMLLACRAFWVASRYSTLMTPQQVEQYVHAGAMGVQSSQPAQIRIGSCWVLAKLAPKAGSTLPPLLPRLYEGLVGLLMDSSEETLHLVLETLTEVLRVDDHAVQQFLPQISRPVLQIWSQNMNDPLISEDALEVLEALAKNPACLGPLATEVLPTLSHTLQHPPPGNSSVLEGSMDLLRTLVKQRNVDVARGVYQSVGAALHRILMSSDDPGTIQSGVELLSALVRTAGAELLLWGPNAADPNDVLTPLLEVLKRLLAVSTSESESCFVGDLLLDMLSALPQEVLAPLLPQILDAVVSKLVNSNMMPLISGLLLAIAKMCVMGGATQLLDALAARSVVLPDGRCVSSLEGVLPILLDRSCDVHGASKVALMATALGGVAESKHPALMHMMVEGKRMDTAGGVKTRSQATKQGGEQWSQVPAAAKLLAVLAEMLADAQEELTNPKRGQLHDGLMFSGSGDDDDDDDDEWDEDEDEDEDENLDVEEEGRADWGASGGLEVCGGGFSAQQLNMLDAEIHSSAGPVKHRQSNDTTGSGLVGSSTTAGVAPTGAAASMGDGAFDACAYLRSLFLRIGAEDQALVETAWRQAMSERQVKAVNELFKA